MNHFLVGNPYKPSSVTGFGWGVNQMYRCLRCFFNPPGKECPRTRMWNGREFTFPPKKYGYAGFPKMVGFPNKPIIFPTKHDQHLGCEMGKPIILGNPHIVSEFGRLCVNMKRVLLTSKEVAKFWPKFHVGLVPEGSNEWLKLTYSETMNHMFCNQYQIEYYICNLLFFNHVKLKQGCRSCRPVSLSAHQPGKTIQSNRLGWEGDDAIRMFHSESPCKQLQNKAIINYLFTTVVNRY